MNTRRVLTLVLAGLLLLSACAPEPNNVPSEAGIGFNLLVDVKGDLSHKRPGWIDFLPLSFGAVLDRDDLLQAAPDAAGLIVCSDLSLGRVSPGYTGGVPCPQNRDLTQVRGASQALPPRRGILPPYSIPYIVSPRHSFVATSTVILRWHASDPSSNRYTVRLYGDTLDWSAVVTGTEVQYSGDRWRPLEPGTPYRLVVTDGNGHSSDEEQSELDLSFALLSPEELASVQAQLAQIDRMHLPGALSADFVRAEIYAIHGMRADAIALLESLALHNSQPRIYQRLGDLYLEVGLDDEAIQAYQQARASYQSIADQFGNAQVLTGLGLASHGKGDDTMARQYLEQALNDYRGLGDSAAADKVAEILKLIK